MMKFEFLNELINMKICCHFVCFSRLSQGAEEIFGDLIAVGTGIAARANNLQARIDRLAVKVVQMDATPEECMLFSKNNLLSVNNFLGSLEIWSMCFNRHFIFLVHPYSCFNARLPEFKAIYKFDAI